MDVYLVPAGPSRHELYCEVAAPVQTDVGRSSRWRRISDSFRRALAEAEAEQARDPTAPPQAGQGRLRRTITRRLAEIVAEQRLLWHLRTEATARLLHRDTLSADQALAETRAAFAADYRRHRRWFWIDALITAVTGPLFFFVPGPNLIPWYFTFRAVGHLLSMRGARQGLSGVAWTAVPTPALSAVAAALPLPDPARREALDQAAATLGLQRLAIFVERIAERSPS